MKQNQTGVFLAVVWLLNWRNWNSDMDGYMMGLTSGLTAVA